MFNKAQNDYQKEFETCKSLTNNLKGNLPRTEDQII